MTRKEAEEKCKKHKLLDCDGNVCHSCIGLLTAGSIYSFSTVKNKGVSIKVAKKDHENCHGWYHCGPECCGECPVCGE